MPSFHVLVGQITRALYGGLFDSRTPLSRRLQVAAGFTASGLRLAAGTSVGKLGRRPERPVILWDFERCPFSRMVRETLSVLDLDAELRPCPRGGTRFRPELHGQGVPRLEDRDAGVVLTGSGTIIRHLHNRYGHARPPRLLHSRPVTLLTALGMSLLSGGRGVLARPSRAPAQPLELWSFESSPFCRMVRQTLCELELPYLLHNVAKDSPRRPEFVARSGKMQVPWLRDPNTGAELFESFAIERYLEQTYAVTA
jgi:glutathione S-transferase